jgi:type VI secretion system protein ImpL
MRCSCGDASKKLSTRSSALVAKVSRACTSCRGTSSSTDEAILLDTAGRYTTQDSDARADAAGWNTFLQLLCKYRGRQPINGVIVAISAIDLLPAGEQELQRHAVAIRERLEELRRNVRIDVPVYFLLTKCDLIAGFSEFFDELGQDARAQVWGATFPIELSESSS